MSKNSIIDQHYDNHDFNLRPQHFVISVDGYTFNNEKQLPFESSWYADKVEECRQKYHNEAIEGILVGKRIQVNNTKKFYFNGIQNI